MKVVFLNFLQIINRFQNLYVPILYTNGGEGFFQEEENPIPQAFNSNMTVYRSLLLMRVSHHRLAISAISSGVSGDFWISFSVSFETFCSRTTSIPAR